MISIIVPIYKVEDYLHRCVDSLLGQTCRDFELILVDDGSPDRCGEICDEYAARDPRTLVIHKKNGGLSDARNAGLEIARGEYIAFVDSDDWVSPRYLELLLKALESTGSDICECSVLRTGGESYPTAEETEPEVFETVPAMEQLICDGKFHQHVWNKLYRREVIGEIRFPRGKTNEDEFWTYQVFGRANRVTRIDTVLYNYFQRPGSIMGTGYSLKRLDALEAKLQRQNYLEAHFPQLTAAARINLHVTCMYSGQMVLKCMTGEEKQQAVRKIEECLAAYPIQEDVLSQAPFGTRVWLTLACVDFWAACRLKNMLRRGF